MRRRHRRCRCCRLPLSGSFNSAVNRRRRLRLSLARSTTNGGTLQLHLRIGLPTKPTIIVIHPSCFYSSLTILIRFVVGVCIILFCFRFWMGSSNLAACCINPLTLLSGVGGRPIDAARFCATFDVCLASCRHRDRLADLDADADADSDADLVDSKFDTQEKSIAQILSLKHQKLPANM